MVFQQKRRFVAGAVCPSCSELDKIMVFNEDGKDFRECVACGFKDEMRFQPQVRELETRVNQPDEVVEAETQVIQFPPPEHKH